MNKKNMILSAVVMILSTGSMLPMQPLTPQQEQARVEQIRNLSKNNALTAAQYAVNGRIDSALIDRDIALFEKDSAQALSKKNWAEGYLYSSIAPGFLKMIGIGSGIGALGAGALAGYSAYLFADISNSSAGLNLFENMANPLVDFFSRDALDRFNNRAQVRDIKSSLLKEMSSKGDQAVLENAPAYAAAGTVGALLLASVSKYIFNSLSRYNSKNTALIQELQEQYDRNQVIIAQLQQIKYQAGL